MRITKRIGEEEVNGVCKENKSKRGERRITRRRGGDVYKENKRPGIFTKKRGEREICKEDRGDKKGRAFDFKMKI